LKAEYLQSTANIITDCCKFRDIHFNKTQFNEDYKCQMFCEDLREGNLKKAIALLKDLSDIADPNVLKKQFYYGERLRHDEEAEIVMLMKEVKTGLMDTGRDAALFEMQNFIKKSVNKRLIKQYN